MIEDITDLKNNTTISSILQFIEYSTKYLEEDWNTSRMNTKQQNRDVGYHTVKFILTLTGHHP